MVLKKKTGMFLQNFPKREEGSSSKYYETDFDTKILSPETQKVEKEK